jgi:hypothetical protein
MTGTFIGLIVAPMSFLRVPVYLASPSGHDDAACPRGSRRRWARSRATCGVSLRMSQADEPWYGGSRGLLRRDDGQCREFGRIHRFRARATAD